MSKITASGQLRHHFWGDYHATIGLFFESAEDALDASTWFPLFVPGKEPHILVWHGTAPELDDVLAVLRSFGAGDGIDSVEHSIDFGDPFEVTISPENVATRAA